MKMLSCFLSFLFCSFFFFLCGSVVIEVVLCRFSVTVSVILWMFSPPSVPTGSPRRVTFGGMGVVLDLSRCFFVLYSRSETFCFASRGRVTNMHLRARPWDVTQADQRPQREHIYWAGILIDVEFAEPRRKHHARTCYCNKMKMHTRATNHSVSSKEVRCLPNRVTKRCPSMQVARFILQKQKKDYRAYKYLFFGCDNIPCGDIDSPVNASRRTSKPPDIRLNKQFQSTKQRGRTGCLNKVKYKQVLVVYFLRNKWQHCCVLALTPSCEIHYGQSIGCSIQNRKNEEKNENFLSHVLFFMKQPRVREKRKSKIQRPKNAVECTWCKWSWCASCLFTRI